MDETLGLPSQADTAGLGTVSGCVSGPSRGHSRLFSLEPPVLPGAGGSPGGALSAALSRPGGVGELVDSIWGQARAAPDSWGLRGGLVSRQVGSRMTADIQASDWGLLAGGSPGSRALDPTASCTLAGAEGVMWGGGAAAQVRTEMSAPTMPSLPLGWGETHQQGSLRPLS